MLSSHHYLSPHTVIFSVIILFPYTSLIYRIVLLPPSTPIFRFPLQPPPPSRYHLNNRRPHSQSFPISCHTSSLWCHTFSRRDTLSTTVHVYKCAFCNSSYYHPSCPSSTIRYVPHSVTPRTTPVTLPQTFNYAIPYHSSL